MLIHGSILELFCSIYDNTFLYRTGAENTFSIHLRYKAILFNKRHIIIVFVTAQYKAILGHDNNFEY